MAGKSQKEAFLSYEADGWFERNKTYISNYKASEDRVIDLMKEYELRPRRILEIGCSAGHRLNAISESFENCEVFGIEPSEKAIFFGKKHFPDVKITKGTADNLSEYETASIDVVIVGFVFYVIDRTMVFRTVAEIDRVLKHGGMLILVDFFSESSLKNEYSYIKDFTAYSFKQNYDEIFTASKLYYLIDKSTLNHNTKMLDASEDYYNKYSISLLKKDIVASYK